MKNKKSCIISLMVIISLLLTTFSTVFYSTVADNNTMNKTGCNINPLFEEWHYYKIITINHEKIEADLNDFPVLISITDNDLKDKAQSDGDDIAFTDELGTQLDHEIESYDSTNGNLIAWVNIPSISSSIDTQIYMYYGNPDCGNQQNINDVWDSDFIMVQHLNEMGDILYDSTLNNNNGESTGTSYANECKINGGREYTGNDYITVEDFPHLSTSLTAEAWVYRDNTAFINIFTKGTQYDACDWVLYLRTNFPTQGIDFGINDHNGNFFRAGTTPEDTWFYLTATYDAGNVVLYVNGAEVGSGTVPDEIINNYANLGIGNENDGGQPWDGFLDEIRVSQIARNNSWIATSFNSMNDPSTFYSIGEEVIIPHEPVISNPYPADGAMDISITISELSFNISDPQEDQMDYTVETSPDIGSDSGSGVYDGRYSVSISGLDYSTEYNWFVNVTDSDDGKGWTNETFTFTTLSPDNHPPYEPSNPDPEDGAIDVSIDTTLSWTGGDPDGNPLTYDIYFGTNSQPPQVASGESDTSYDPETLEYDTKYYWKIIAWDNQSESTEGDIWEFTTEEQLISVEIVQPLENYFYIRDTALIQLDNRTIIYGPITIIANVTSIAEVDRVEFYIDGILSKEEPEHVDSEAPYEYNWSPIICFQKTIKVIAYDVEGNNDTFEIDVFKWRLHPVLLLAGAAFVLNPNTRLIRPLTGYTIVRGLVFNPTQVGRTLSFRAIKLHYTKVKPLRTETGVIRLKKCSIKTGKNIQYAFGPLGRVSWIYCVYRGTSLEKGSLFQSISSGRSGKLFN